MITWKTKLFGDNRMNFYGWIVAGLLIVFSSFVLFVLAFFQKDEAQTIVLAAIWVVVGGHFCLALQNYLARVAKAIETDDEQKR
jgi:predicted MFS family arabinose efflux permease